MGPGAWLSLAIGLVLGGALAGALLVLVLRPWLVRTALAHPSARGLHTIPTPQGGGIAVLAACTAVAGVGAWLFGFDAKDVLQLCAVLLAALGLAVLGLIDDIRPLPVFPRLVLQLCAVAAGVVMLPAGTRVLPFLPFGAERAVLVLGGAWFVNLTNFMDGMDWMTVVNNVPVAAALVVFWTLGVLPVVPGVVALGLLAGLLGFAPFNKPVASLFLGDVGSLPIGFLVAFCLFALAGQDGGRDPGTLTAAILLPLYPMADTGLTLAWRLRQGARIWRPHRDHFYQAAVARGSTVWHVLGRLVLTNVLLALLAWASLGRSASAQALAVGIGMLVAGTTLVAFSRLDSKKASA